MTGMRRTSHALLAASLVWLLPAPWAPPVRAQASPLAGFDAHTAKAAADWHVPGFAIAVVKDGRVVVAKGYGRNAEQPDFVVTFDTVVTEDYEWTSWSGHAEVAKGLLVLRMTETAQKEPFWMGADTAGLTGKITPEKAWKKVEHATRRIFAGFPPPAG